MSDRMFVGIVVLKFASAVCAIVLDLNWLVLFSPNSLRKLCLLFFFIISDLFSRIEVVLNFSPMVLAFLQVRDLMSSPKCSSLVVLLQRLDKGDHQLVIASQYPGVLDICQLLLQHLNLSHVRLDELTPKAHRAAVASSFRARNVRIALLQSCVATDGDPIDLSTADTCVFYDISLDPAVRITFSETLFKSEFNPSRIIYQRNSLLVLYH